MERTLYIRVGTRIYGKNRTFTDPSFPGYSPIVCLTASTEYGSLGPYVLKTSDGIIFENLWQFSKVYPSVPASYSKTITNDKTSVVWSHPKEVHTKVLPTQVIPTKVLPTKTVSEKVLKNRKQVPNEKYWAWRKKGMMFEAPLRWPVGRKFAKTCLYAIPPNPEGEDPFRGDPSIQLDYISARKQIYLKYYADLVSEHPDFLELKERLQNGEKLLIIEVDGPHQESLEYYQNTYGVEETFIRRNTMRATFRNLNIMLNDPLHPFGHGYCLSAALLGLAEELQT